MKRYFTGMVLSCALAPASVAQAACGGGETGSAVCIYSDRGAYESEASNLSVTVKPGAVVTSAGDDAAIDISEDFTVLDMHGVLRSADNAVRGGHGFVLRNTGQISAGRNAIELTGQSGAEIHNSGTILATYQAVNMDARDGFGGTGNTLVNEGRIASTRGEAVEAGDDASIYNAEGAVMQAYDDAVQVAERASVVNHGLIRTTGMAGDPQDAIDIDSGTILNGKTGQIISDMEAAVDFDRSGIASVIDNAGEISGVKGIIVETQPGLANTAAQQVINRTGGVIAGRGGVALLLGEGADQLINHAGARIEGSAFMGPDADVIVLEGSYQGVFGGKGAVMDGGTGADRVEMPDYALDQIVAVARLRNGFVLSLDNGSGAFEIALHNWESFSLGGSVYNAQQIDALAPKKTRPNGAMLMAAGFVGLGLIGARRRLGRSVMAACRACRRAIAGAQSVRRTSA